MNSLIKKYLYQSLKRLEKWMPEDADHLLAWYEQHPEYINIEGNEDEYIYCLFSLPCISSTGKEVNRLTDIDSNHLERITLLVFDRNMIIADISALHTSMHAFMFDPSIFEFISTESDWNYLAHYSLCGTYFPTYPYPAVNTKPHQLIHGETLLFTNAYVTTAYRRRSIFTVMMQMVKEHALRNVYENTDLYSVISLDPDIAQYGPDTKNEPYYYSFEVDEPKRLINAEIMQKLNFEPIRLELDGAELSDGAKLWFALQHEKELFHEAKIS